MESVSVLFPSLPPATKLLQDNIFRSVCQEFCWGGVVWAQVQGGGLGVWPGGFPDPGGVGGSGQGGCLGPDPGGGWGVWPGGVQALTWGGGGCVQAQARGVYPSMD